MPRITIRNLDTEINRRIKLIKTPTSSVNIGEQSGAVSEQSDSVHICLSPFEQSVISCDGATNSMYFFELWGVWELYVDDIFQVENKIPMLIDYIESQFAGTLLAEFRHFDGEYWRDSLNLKNLDNVNHRIKLVPVFDDGYTLPEFVENPTFTANDDGSLTFCLSEFEQPIINCDGAKSDAVLRYFSNQDTLFAVKINGEAISPAGNSEIPIENDGGLQGYFFDNNMQVFCSFDGYGNILFDNQSEDFIRIELRISDQHDWATFENSDDNPNPTVLLSEPEGIGEGGIQLYRKASFCLAPPSECNPTYFAGEAVRADEIERREFEYSLNGSEFQELVLDYNSDYVTSQMFNKINQDTGISDLFVAGGTGYFGFVDNGPSFNVEGGDGSDTSNPTTVILRDTEIGDVISHLFGSSEFTLHSCGPSTPIDT